MARIRTIKPEFPQSESMGRISRDARLLFVMLWTICDDSGRTRAASRMLASLLFPYDSDAPELIDGWLLELEREQCVVRYQAEGATYLQVRKWLSHQKIDKPSASRLPEFVESSRIVANPRESSPLDLVPRTKDLGEEGKKKEQARTPLRGSRLPDNFPAQSDIDWAEGKRTAIDIAEERAKFRDYWTAKAGADARKVDWPATWRNWIRNARASPGARAGPAPKGKRATWYEQSGQAIDHAKQSSDLVLDSDSGRRALPVPAGA